MGGLKPVADCGFKVEAGLPAEAHEAFRACEPPSGKNMGQFMEIEGRHAFCGESEKMCCGAGQLDGAAWGAHASCGPAAHFGHNAHKVGDGCRFRVCREECASDGDSFLCEENERLHEVFHINHVQEAEVRGDAKNEAAFDRFKELCCFGVAGAEDEGWSDYDEGCVGVGAD